MDTKNERFAHVSSTYLEKTIANYMQRLESVILAVLEKMVVRQDITSNYLRTTTKSRKEKS